jgi:hypothetical protein
MNKENWNIWNNITFKSTHYNKNYDLVNDNDNIITEYCGTISEIKIKDYKPPIIIGEYNISVWNIELGKTFNVNFNKLIKEHHIEDIYCELMKIIENKNIDINKFNKIILITTLVIHPDYRKHEITEEFIEYIYRNLYDENNIIIAFVKPFQDNIIDKDFYFNQKVVEIHQSIQNYDKIEIIPAHIYYSLDNLLEKKDTEINEYKLFSVATKCGFSRIDDSYLFIYSPEKTLKKMLEKRELYEKK